jgi:hypothetical protein
MDSDFSKYTGIGWGIPFHEISSEWDEPKCQDYCSTMRRKFAAYTKAWNNDLHSEWLTRNYLAVKMILSASVMLTSFEYCREKNVRIVQHYLLYYAALSCCRAVHFTSPDFKLQNTDLYAMTHQKIINVTGDHLERNFPNTGANAKRFLEQLRADREMFSYRFPAQGISRSDTGDNFERVVDLCSLLAENAELNSECLDASFQKNVAGKYEINPEIVKLCFLYESDAGVHVDEDDYYRTDYMTRKMTGPCSLSTMATEGLVKDFFGSWCPEEDDNDQYNPDHNWQIIFPFH